jgi:outer membrane protein assembly factor BamB/tRNA A-37 threonylcarbamoyl transferase component Bud32
VGFGRIGAAALVAILLAPSVQADWLQWNHDAQRSSLADRPGPEWGDVALRVKVPGCCGTATGPVIIGDAAYVTTSNNTPPYWRDQNTKGHQDELANSTNALWRIDLHTGEVRKLADVPGWTLQVLSDGRQLIVSYEHGYISFDRSGNELWRWMPWKGFLPYWYQHGFTECRAAAIEGDFLYPACTEAGRWLPDDYRPMYPLDENTQIGRHAYIGVLAKVNISGPQPVDEWVFTMGGSDPFGPGRQTQAATQDWGWHLGGQVLGSSVMANRVFGLYADYAGTDGPTGVDLVAADLASGEYQYRKNAIAAPDQAEAIAACTSATWPNMPVGRADEAYVKIRERLVAFNPVNGVEKWFYNTTAGDAYDSWDTVGQPVAMGDTLYVPGASSMHAVGLRTHTARWVQPFVAETGAILMTPFTIGDGSTLFVPTSTAPGAREYPITECQDSERAVPTVQHLNITALDAATGKRLWTLPFSNGFEAQLGTVPHVAMITTGMSDGRLVVYLLDGTLTIIGRTDASPKVALSSLEEQRYPSPGELVRVDLGASAPGSMGGVVAEYRVIWGDGSDSGWQKASVLAHAYADPGVVTARFAVRTSSGQSASTTFPFQVGGTPPASPDDPNAAPLVAFDGSGTAVFAAVVADAKEFFWGPAGWWMLVFVAIIIAAFILWAHQRRRSRLAREIAAAEAALAATDGDQTAALAVLSERRIHASKLLLNGKLTSSEHSQLVAHLAGLEGTLGPKGPLPATLAPGTLLLNRYKVIRELGQGAYGRAILADDVLVKRRVVLKSLREKMSEEGLREARAIGAIRHSNVITLYDVVRMGEHPLLVMEFAENGSLRDRIEKEPLSVLEFRTVARGLLQALDAVHRAGALHRDVKPSNVLLTAAGDVKLADFGIAKPAGKDATVRDGTATVAVGTVRYMAPEQARGRRTTAQSDLYSAALTLFEAWTGEPFVAPGHDSDAEVQMRVAAARPLNKKVGARPVQAWFRQALAPLPEDRFQTANAMLKDFERAWHVSRASPAIEERAAKPNPVTP